MGYYTRYRLKSNDGINHKEGIAENSGFVPFNVACKWHLHEEHMRSYSKKFPDVIFTLSGEGEEAGDLWIKYFKDGLMQNCEAKIIYDDFNDSFLV